MKTIYVDCRRDGKLIATYDFGWPITAVPGPLPERNTMTSQAKDALTSQRLAFPPYDGIEFVVRYP